jgi:AraC-like DNA-binding protein
MTSHVHVPDQQLVLGDALSRVAMAMAVNGSIYYRIEASDPFCMEMSPQAQRVCFHIVLRGTAHLEVAGNPALVVHEGDVILVNGRRRHRLMDLPGRPVESDEEVRRRSGYEEGEPLRIGDGLPTLVMLCGEYTLADHINRLLDALPGALHIPAQQTDNVSLTLALVDRESRAGGQGSRMILDRLSEVVLMQVLRRWLDSHERPTILTAMEDPKIGRAVAEMQARPADPWTVMEMAKVAGMSRTSFALRFRNVVGVSPMKFVVDWRMQLARGFLRDVEVSLDEVSELVGYASQAAFAKAFRKHHGMPPGEFRQGAIADSASG